MGVKSTGADSLECCGSNGRHQTTNNNNNNQRDQDQQNNNNNHHINNNAFNANNLNNNNLYINPQDEYDYFVTIIDETEKYFNLTNNSTIGTDYKSDTESVKPKSKNKKKKNEKPKLKEVKEKKDKPKPNRKLRGASGKGSEDQLSRRPRKKIADKTTKFQLP